MKIKELYKNVVYNYTFSKRMRRIYLNILFVVISFIFALYLGYMSRNHRIQELVKIVNVYDKSEAALISDIRDLNEELEEFDRMKNDADYYRYIAFKHAKVIIPEKTNKNDIIFMHKMANKYKIPYKYYYRLIYQESRYNPKAKSHVGASGYMQIMPATYAYLFNNYSNSEDNETFDIKHLTPNERNILLGTYYLRKLYNKYGDWKLTFAAYNAGPGNVAEYNGVPPFNETQNYIAFIMKKI